MHRVPCRKIDAYENCVLSRKIYAYEKVSEAEKFMHMKKYPKQKNLCISKSVRSRKIDAYQKQGGVETDTSTIDAMSKEAKLPFSNSKESKSLKSVSLKVQKYKDICNFRLFLS